MRNDMPAQEQPTLISPDEARTHIAKVLDGLCTLQGTDVDLDVLPSREEMVRFAEHMLADVRDAAFISAALETKWAQICADLIAAEGERRGGDQKSEEIKVTPSVTLIPPAARMARSRIRPLAGQSALVDEYIEKAKETKTLPTKTGAVRYVRTRVEPTARRTVTTPVRSRAEIQFSVAQVKSQRRADTILAALDSVADGTHYSDAALRRAIRRHGPHEVQFFLQGIRLIPWLTITRDETGTTFTIDHELRDICDGHRPRPTLDGGQSVAGFLRHLRDEIRRRRKENHDELHKRKWNSELILKREQTALLDWIEEQLDRLP